MSCKMALSGDDSNNIYVDSQKNLLNGSVCSLRTVEIADCDSNSTTLYYHLAQVADGGGENLHTQSGQLQYQNELKGIKITQDSASNGAKYTVKQSL